MRRRQLYTCAMCGMIHISMYDDFFPHTIECMACDYHATWRPIPRSIEKQRLLDRLIRNLKVLREYGLGKYKNRGKPKKETEYVD